jgi:hypothetical protein
MTGAIDFSEITQSIKTYQSGLGETPIEVTGDEQRRMPDTLHDLMHAIMKNDYNPQKCAFYMHPKQTKRLIDDMDYYSMGISNPYQFDGCPIRPHPTMPEDTILFMAPDSVGLGGKVHIPNIIAYTELDRNKQGSQE